MYVVAFGDMKQRNKKSGVDRPVKRVALGAGDEMPPLYDQRVEEYRRALQSRFRKVITRKPAASRARSTEVYQLAVGLK